MADLKKELQALWLLIDKKQSVAYNVEDIETGCPIHTSKLFEDLNSAALMTDLFRWWTKRPGADVEAIVPQAGAEPANSEEFWELCQLLFFNAETDRRTVAHVLQKVIGNNEELMDYFVMVGFPTMFMHFASAEFLGYAIEFVKALDDQPVLFTRLLGSVTLHQSEFINGWKQRLFKALVSESYENKGTPMLSIDSVKKTFRVSLADLPEIVWRMWSETADKSAMVREVVVPVLLELSVTPEFAAAHDVLCGLAKDVSDAGLVDHAFEEQPVAWAPPEILEVVYTGELRGWYSDRDLGIVRTVVLNIKSDKPDFYLKDVTSWGKTNDCLKRERAVKFCEACLHLAGGRAPSFPATEVTNEDESEQRRWKQLRQRASDMHVDVQDIRDDERVRDADPKFQVYVYKQILSELDRGEACRNNMRDRMRNWTILKRMAEHQEVLLQTAAVSFGLTQMASLLKFASGQGEEKIVKLFEKLLKSHLPRFRVSKSDLARVYHEYMTSVRSGVDMEPVDKVGSHLSLKMIGLTVYAATLGLLQTQKAELVPSEYFYEGKGGELPPIFEEMMGNAHEFNPLRDLMYLWTSFSTCSASGSPGLRQCLNLIAIPAIVRQMNQLQSHFVTDEKRSAFAFFSYIMTQNKLVNFQPDMKQAIGRIEQASSLCHHFALLPEQFEACQTALRWYPTDC